jgi:allantoicase
VMGDGWETARRRDDANDWVEVRLAAEGVIRQVELDTTHFKGNAPGWFRLTDAGGAELIPRTRLQPDTRHVFRVAAAAAATRVRVDVYPDGGFARLRLYGELTDQGGSRLVLNWYNRLPASHLAEVLEAEAGLPAADVAALAAARPVSDAAALPDPVARLLR